MRINGFKTTWILAAAAAFSVQAETLQEWKYRTDQDISAAFINFNDSRENFLRAIAPDQKTPDGENSLKIVNAVAPKTPVSWARQVSFNFQKPLAAGTDLKITFYYKGSVPGTLEFVPAQQDSPWQAIGPQQNVSVSADWKKAELSFLLSADHPEKLSMPRLMVGQYPIGESLWIGPVTVETRKEQLPYLLKNTWKLLPGKQSAAELPAGAQEVAIAPDGYQINAPGADTVTFYQEFESEKEGVMVCGMAADWFFDCYLNGSPVYSTSQTGNDSHRFVPGDHPFELPVRKGKNLLAVHVKPGSAGWKFNVGSADMKSRETLTIDESGKYRAVDLKNLRIVPGSALDFSEINGVRPDVEKMGRVIVNRRGRLAFEAAPEQPVRFMSFNLDSGNWRQRLESWSKTDVEEFAEKVRLKGYNMIRFHQPGWFFLGWKIHDLPHKTLAEVGLPQKPEEIAWSAQSVDVFDYLVFSLKKRGIYLNLDISDGGVGYSMARKFGAGETLLKWNIYSQQAYRNYWEAIARGLLLHVNPYTGKRLAEDPVLANIDFVNELDMTLGNADGLRVLQKNFDEVQREAGIAPENFTRLSQEVLTSGSPAGERAGNFLISTMQAQTDWFFKTVRELGYPGLFSNWDMIIRTMEIPVRAKLPIICQHIYFAHPGWSPRPEPLNIPECAYWNGGPQQDTVCDQKSALDSNFFRQAAVARFLDRPYCITEYSQSAPNRYRHERGLFFGSYAALQGWDMLTPHADMVVKNIDPMVWFDYASDPIAQASEAVTMFAFLRGDVAEAKHSLEIKLDPAKMFPRHYLAAIGDDYAKLAMLTRVGILYPDVKPLMPVGSVSPDAELEPTQFSALSDNTWWVGVATTDDPRETARGVQLLREKGILPPGNRTDLARKIYQSETGEITLDARAETLSVETPRLSGVIVKGGKGRSESLQVNQASVPAMIAAVSLDKSQNLTSAKHLLLIVSTNAFNRGMRFANDTLSRCQDLGTFPVLLESGEFEIAIRTSLPQKPTVYALNMDGSRGETVPVELRDGELKLKLDTASLKTVSPFFEIID